MTTPPLPPDRLLTFGKYKGEPVATLLADSAYCRWLVGNDWFFHHYPDLFEVVTEHLATLRGKRRPRRPASDLPKELDELRFDFHRL